MGTIRRNKVVRNISWLIFDKIFVILVGLIVTVKVANHYGPYQYGIYQYSLSIVTILGVIVALIDGRVVKKYYCKDNQGHIIYNTTIAKVLLSFITFLIGIVILLILRRDSVFNTIYIILLLNNIGNNLGFGLQNYFEYQLKSKNVVIASNIATTISSIMQLIAISVEWQLTTIVAIIFMSSLSKLIILYYQFVRNFNISIKTRFDEQIVKAIIYESIPLAIAAAASTVYHKVDQTMIGAMLNETDVGIYSISNKMISAVAIAIGPIQVSIFPRMIDWYNKNKELYYKKYLQLTTITTWIYIVGMTFVYFVAPIIFERFFSVDYLRSLDVFKIHVLGTFFAYNAALRSSHYTLSGSTNIMMKSQIFAMITNVVLNYILIPVIGILGAAIATVITEFLSLFISNLVFKDGKKIFWIQLKGLNPYNLFIQ